MTPTAWKAYVHAMRAHLAASERLADRLRFFVGDGLSYPKHSSPADRVAWLGLVRDTEDAALTHREALEALLAVDGGDH